MSNWKECKLNEIADLIMGQSPPSSAYNSDGIGMPFLQGCAEFGKTYPRPFYNCTEPKKVAPKNSILISVRAPVGLINLSDTSYVIGRGLAAIVPTTSDLKFLYYQVNLNAKELDRVSQGSTFLAINSKDLANFSLLTPDKPVQKKIGFILSKIDTVIEKTEQAIVKYKCIKQGMLHDLFTRGIGADGKLRPTVQQAPELYKPSALGMIPMEWDEGTLTNLSELITDGSHFSPTPISDGHLIVNVKDMGEYDINYDTCTRISEREFLLLKAQNCSPKKGDVLLSKDGTVGRVLLYNGNREVVVLSSIAIIRPGEKLMSEYLYLFLQTDYFEKQLRALMSGSALKRIVLRDINLLKSVYPINKEEQGAIFRMMSSIENKIQQEEKYLLKIISLKQGLMADLLTGKKEVKINEELVSEKEMMV